MVNKEDKKKKVMLYIYIDEEKKKELKREANKLDIPLNSFIKMRLFKKEKEVKNGN